MFHFCIFGCEAYMFLPSEVCTNKLVLYSELMIFIGYENNSYCFMYYIQAKQCKLYNKLLKKNKFRDKVISTFLVKMDLLQYLFHTYLFFSFKTILLLIFLNLLFLINLNLPYLPQSLKILQQRLKRITILTLILKYNHLAFNNLCNLL